MFALAPNRPPPSTGITQDYRSWPGAIHHHEAVALPTPPAEETLHGVASVRSPETRAADASPTPTYPTHATPMTPPASYASLLKDAGAPAPRPSSGSRAAVWPTQHPSPLLEMAASTSLRQSRSRKRAVKEGRRAEDHERTGRPQRGRGSRSSQRGTGPSSRPNSVVHSYSFSYVQEIVIQGSIRHHDPCTSPEDGRVLVKERDVPSQSKGSGMKGHPTSSRTDPASDNSRELARFMTGVRLSGKMSHLTAFRADDLHAGKNVAGRPSASANARRGGAA